MYAISVIVPIFNVEDYVKEAIDSVLWQDVDNVEIILINDGSTDRSGQIVNELYSAYENVKIIHQKNAGLSEARNSGLRVATGKYILYLDSDDFFSANVFKTLLKIISENDADLLMFSGNKVGYDFDGKVASIEKYGISANKTFESGIDAYCYLRVKRQYYTGVYYQMIKKEILDKYKILFIPGILHEDHLYTYTVLMKTNKTIISSFAAYNYRVRKNSIMTTNTKNGKRFEGFATTYFEMKKVRPQRQMKYYEQKVYLRHLNIIKWLAVKYLCNMSKDDERYYSNLIDRLKNDKLGERSCLMIKLRNIYRLFLQ